MESLRNRKLFWQGKRVLVTGHTGFKGSWISMWLQMLGEKVTGYSLPASTSPSLFLLAKVEEDMHSVIGDIRDFDSLKKCIADCQPEIVIHMAAQPLAI